ncbi:MAG: coproporphyrinogen dehydrogenase HemZ [Syntrophomonadaceae bacterium]
MPIKLKLYPKELYDNMHELVRMAYPGQELLRGGDYQADIELLLERTIKDNTVHFHGSIKGVRVDVDMEDNYPQPAPGEESRRQLSRLTRRFVYDLLAAGQEKELNSYGILTGMRPVKLVHRLLDQGLEPEKVLESLGTDFRVNPGKARLLTEVASNNRPVVDASRLERRALALYVGIPFCPSRCYYCSFPGGILRDYEQDIKTFLEALYCEVKQIAAVLKDLGFWIQSVYLGGGTPTVLSYGDLADLFELLHRHFIGPGTEEITVEAGRPDTLTPEKMVLFKQAGVGRVCINPQTMNETTLHAIGRNHDLKGVVQSLEWARQAGIKTINMDLIVGLPGEGLEENRHTAEEILRLKPENLTVHTLAVKRGSTLARMEGVSGLGEKEAEVHRAVDLMAELFRNAGYQPYYLYRQKYIKASLENIGYSLPGFFSVYNIRIMEECQTLLGLGGGAGSKFFNWNDESLTSFYNPKNPSSYCASIQRLIAAKVDKLRALH